jgi:spore germination protein
MTIHTVERGDTIYSIAERYIIPYERLQKDNILSPNDSLNIGRALIITYPEQTHIVQDGDTLASIASTYGVGLIQLLRNNPELSDRVNYSLIIGEELIISYNNEGKKLKVNGFANVFISIDVLRKTLPFLTYITILNYRVTPTGDLIDINDTNVIQISKEYGVAPLMFISALDEQGRGSYGTTRSILINPEYTTALINNVRIILREKDYYGLFIGFQNILLEDMPLYIDFVANITDQLNREGYEVFVSLVPSTFGFSLDIPYDFTYYSDIGQATNNVTLITYQWTSSFIPQFAQTTASYLKAYLDFVVTQIPPEKIFLGLTRIAYDWELPYVEGETLGRFLTNALAINLASQVEATIQYDEVHQTPYFNYFSLGGVEHFVWFKDARTIDAITNLVYDYGLKGIAVWNIMYYYPETWLVLNSQYDIETILENTLAL